MQDDYVSPPIIHEVAELLGVPIPEDDLDAHIIALNALQYAVAVNTVDSLKLLYEKKKQILFPRDIPNMKMTELDRTTRLNADTAVLQRDYELLTKIELLIKDRIEVCLRLL